MLTHRLNQFVLVLASLSFACEPANDGNARWDQELAATYAAAHHMISGIDKTEGALLLLLGTTLPAAVPPREPNLPVLSGPEPPVIVGQLLVDVPEAGAKAGDRVVFRPDDPDWRRRCVIMHTTEGEQFLPALADGTMEIIASSSASVEDPRALLEDRLQHPPAPSFRVA